MDGAMDGKACLRAAELVEQGHCKHAPARNALGISVLPTDEAAESWCATGALEKAYAEIYGKPVKLLATWNAITERITPAACQARNALPWKRLKRAFSVPAWNNLQSTRPGQVAAFLRKMAEVIAAQLACSRDFDYAVQGQEVRNGRHYAEPSRPGAVGTARSQWERGGGD